MNIIKNKNNLHIYLILITIVASLFPFSNCNKEKIINVPKDYNNIQDAIDAAEDGYRILVDEGIYNGTVEFKGKAIILQSLKGANDTFIDARGNGTAVSIDSQSTGYTSILDGFTIFGGSSKTNGGGISCSASSVTINNCIIKKNSAQQNGGGIYLFKCLSADISYCEIESNSAESGGGVFCGASIVTFNKCNITNNSATNGGGILIDRSRTINLNGCDISKNTAEKVGGGVYLTVSTPKLTDCTISGNKAGSGGGIFCEDSTLLTSNSYINANLPENLLGCNK